MKCVIISCVRVVYRCYFARCVNSICWCYGMGYEINVGNIQKTIIVAMFVVCGIAISYYDALANVPLTIDEIHTASAIRSEQRTHSRVRLADDSTCYIYNLPICTTFPP